MELLKLRRFFCGSVYIFIRKLLKKTIICIFVNEKNQTFSIQSRGSCQFLQTRFMKYNRFQNLLLQEMELN